MEEILRRSECSTCREYTDSDKKCRICNSNVCEYCFDECSLLEIDEWLDEMPNTCDRCHRIGCGNCISTCYQCWNIDESYDLVCKDCSDLSKNDCDKHSYWDFCPKHQTSYDSCPACAQTKHIDIMA